MAKAYLFASSRLRDTKRERKKKHTPKIQKKMSLRL
jgi:hypothetical protein